MAESSLSLKYADLLAEVATFLGYGNAPEKWSRDQLTEIDRYVQSGVRQFYYPPTVEGLPAGYEWSFLNPTATIDTVQSDAEQDLPDMLARVMGGFYFAPEIYSVPILVVSEHRILALLQQSTDEGRPQYAAIRFKSGTTKEEGQRQEVKWWPIPDAAYTLTYRYEGYTGKLTESLPYPLGGMKHSETIIESCLAVAEQRANDERGLHWEKFISLLATSIAQDRKSGAQYYGPMSGPEGGARINEYLRTPSGDITYKGVTW